MVDIQAGVVFSENQACGAVVEDRPIALVDVTRIVQESNLWPRQRLDAERVALFVELIEERGHDVLPPLVLVVDGERFLLADGWHRLAAFRKLDWRQVPAVVVEPVDGPAADVAYEYALRFSTSSAKPLSARERRDAVRRLLATRGDLTQRQIARLAGVSDATVSRVVNELEGGADQSAGTAPRSSCCCPACGNRHTTAA